jgi:hypothetical protein
VKGKTAYFHKNYATTHIRFSAEEIFHQNKDISLHRVLNRVIEYLQKGRNIVIDDQNRLPRTRRSYLNAVKDHQNKGSLGLVKTVSVVFEPIGGIQQCLWAHEWQLALQSIKPEQKSEVSAKNFAEFEEWFHLRGEKIHHTQTNQKSLLSNDFYCFSS